MQPGLEVEFDPDDDKEVTECSECGYDFVPQSDLQFMCVDCMEVLPLNEVITGRRIHL